MKLIPYFFSLISILILSGCGAKKSDLRDLNVNVQNLATELQMVKDNNIALEAKNQKLSDTNIQMNVEIFDLKKSVGEVKAIAEESFRLSHLPQGAGRGKFAVHLASYRNEKQVSEGWKILKENFPDILGALEGIFSEFEMPNGGRFLRIKAGPFISEAAAQAICDKLEVSAQYCMVSTFEGQKLSKE